MDIRRVKEAREELESRIEKGHNNLVGLLESTLPELLSSLNQSLQILSSFNQRPFEPLSPLSGDSSYRLFKKSKHDPHPAACIEDEEEQEEEIRKGKHKPVVDCVSRSGFLTEEDMVKEVEELLNKKSFKEAALCEAGAEISDLLYRPTSKERAILNKFKTKSGQQVQHYCLALTKEDCRQKSESYTACDKVHFRRIIAPHTDINLGDCSFLDTCRHMKTCKYVHYELDQTLDVQPMMGIVAPPKPLKTLRAEYCSEEELGQSQWISCDIRNFRMDILGQFGVIMADPPWDIHMNLPYGTMEDKEMLNLKVPALQTDGLIFLWVTGRAMELGRECLKEWGYKCVEEIIWVKTNQLQRIIRTGRTGHWLNHSKEHCLIGIKGNPTVNRNIDTDVIVAEVRETSRKPDEMYALLERISPGTRKLELFARMHNTQAGWLSLGNQLDGVRLVDEGLRARYKAAYPDVEVQPTSPPRSPVANASEGKPCSSQDIEMVS